MQLSVIVELSLFLSVSNHWCIFPLFIEGFHECGAD